MSDDVHDDIHVGRVGDDIFIGVTDGCYERCTLPLTGRAINTIRFSVDDAEWLVTALRKEIRNARKPEGRHDAD